MGMTGERAAAPAGDDAAPAVQVRNAIALVVRRAWLVVLLGAVALVAGAGDGSRARAVTTSEVVDLVLNPDDVSGDDVLDLGANTFNAVAARVLPGSLPIEIPGLEDLGPVDMPQSTVTIIRPDAPLQVGGWIIKIEATPQLDMSVPPGSAPPKQLDVTIELEWEDADGDLSPTVSTQMSSSSPLSVAEALRFAGMLDAGAAPTDSIATDTVLTNLAVDALPSLATLLNDSFVRGAVTGLGLVNLWAGFADLAALLRAGGRGSSVRRVSTVTVDPSRSDGQS